MVVNSLLFTEDCAAPNIKPLYFMFCRLASDERWLVNSQTSRQSLTGLELVFFNNLKFCLELVLSKIIAKLTSDREQYCLQSHILKLLFHNTLHQAMIIATLLFLQEKNLETVKHPN